MEHVFHDSEFMSAREKRLVLKAWVRFLKNGLRFEDFSDRLYKHLMLHCGFIAHYNRLGFYEEYFERGEDTTRFLSQFDDRGECRSVEGVNSWWFHGEYADINKAMIEEGTKYIPGLIERAQASQRDADITEAQRLLAKHGTNT
ncbi:MAG TPA: hypothetical protein VE422_30750 [Terriglobia bacterium]|nr:hypothetical protein [Terriglobia bacterium]